MGTARDRSRLSSDWSRSRESSWRPRHRSRRDRVESPAISQDRGDSGSRASTVSAAPSVPEPLLCDLARLFKSLSGSCALWDVLGSSLVLAGALPGTGSWPGSSVPGGVSAPSACLPAGGSTPGMVPPNGGPLSSGLTGLSETSRELRRERSSSGKRSRSSKKCRGDRSPSPAGSSRAARSSPSASSVSSGAAVPEGVMPPPSAGRLGSGGGH